MEYAKITNVNGFVYKMTDCGIIIDYRINTLSDDPYPIKIVNTIDSTDGTYVRCDLGCLYNVNDIKELSRQEYINEFLKTELRRITISPEVVQLSTTELMNNLVAAINDSVICVSRDDLAIHRYWDKVSREAFIKCIPHNFYAQYDDKTKEMMFWLVSERPGIFIGRGGEIYNYWENLLQGIVDKWLKEKNFNFEFHPKVSIRIQEQFVFKLCNSKITL